VIRVVVLDGASLVDRIERVHRLSFACLFVTPVDF
jgi:hypothetical protein